MPQLTLELGQIRPGQRIVVVDKLRGHGYDGKVDWIKPDSQGATMIAFTAEGIQFVWTAAAMGLTHGVSSFWKTYRNRVGHGSVHFGHLDGRHKSA